MESGTILSRKDFELTIFLVNLRVSVFVSRLGVCLFLVFILGEIGRIGVVSSPGDGLGYYLHGLSRPSVCMSTRCMCLSFFEF